MPKQTSNAWSVVNLAKQEPLALQPTEDPIADTDTYKYLITSGDKAGTNWGNDDRSESGEKGMTVKEVESSVDKSERTESGDKGMTSDEYYRRATSKSSDFLAPRSAPPAAPAQHSTPGDSVQPIKRPAYKRDGKMEGDTIYEADYPTPTGSTIRLGLMQQRQDRHVYAQPHGYNRAKAFRDPEQAYQWLIQMAKQRKV